MKTVTIFATLVFAVGAWAADDAATAPKQATSLKPQAASCGAEAITIPQMLSYQGKLTDTFGLPVADTLYAIRFRLYAQPTGGTQFWEENQNVRTTGGLFSVLLGSVTPIGSVPDAGAAYLGMAVAGGNEMTPRLRLVSSAYCYLAGKSANADLLQGKDTTALDSRYVNEGQTSSVTSAMITNGAVANADIANTAVTTAKLADTAVTLSKIAPAGATAGQVVKWTGSTWAPRNDSVGGGGGGTVTSVSQATGVVCTPNPITTTGTVGFDATYGDGRYVNVTGDSMTGALAVQGDLRVYGKGRIGPGNSNAGTAAFVAGSGNTASANYSSVAGGTDNAAGGVSSHVGGGSENQASGGYSFVGGGEMNYATGVKAAIGGGQDNSAGALYATVGGGDGNTAGDAAADTGATIAGGYVNAATGMFATVGGGRGNAADTSYATVGGGKNDSALSLGATVCGGSGNVANGALSAIAGGGDNTAEGGYATVGGGQSNNASGSGACIGGGQSNTAPGLYAAVGGGQSNDASGMFSVVPGGRYNRARGYLSFAAGARAHANHSGCFVWGDSTIPSSDTVYTTGANQWRVRAKGGAWFFSNGAMTTGAYLAPGSNSWESACDSATKEDFRAVDRKALLDKVAALRVRDYKMKDQNDGTRHIGPVAQDFHNAFEYGGNETSINMADADGVMLAAIQALYEDNRQLRQELEALRAQVGSQAK